MDAWTVLIFEFKNGDFKNGVRNEDNIEFLSSVSLSSLKQAFSQNFTHSDSENGEISSSSEERLFRQIKWRRRIRDVVV